MDIKILMDILARHDRIKVLFADEVEEVLASIYRIASDCPLVDIDEEMSAVLFFTISALSFIVLE